MGPYIFMTGLLVLCVVAFIIAITDKKHKPAH